MRRMSAILLTTVMLLVTILIVDGIEADQTEPIPVDSSEPPAIYDVIETTYIDGDQELRNFTMTHASQGNGSISSPFVIKNTAFPNDANDAGLTLESTSLHLVLRNCFFYIPDGVQDYQDGYGIIAQYSSNITIEKCEFQIRPGSASFLYSCHNFTFIGNKVFSKIFDKTTGLPRCEGFVISESADITMIGNEFHECERGISTYSERTIIRSNKFFDNPIGVEIFYSPGSMIEDNIILGSETPIRMFYTYHATVRENEIEGEDGIYALGGKNNTIMDNHIKGNRTSIQIITGYDQRIINNTIEGPGIVPYFRLSEAGTAEISGNTVNGLPLIALIGIDGHTIAAKEDIGQIILMDSKNITIQSVSISDAGSALTVLYCQNLKLSDISIEAKNMPLRCEGSSSVTIAGLNIQNDAEGTFFHEVEGLSIRDSSIQTDETSLYLRSSTDIEITDCRLISREFSIDANECSDLEIRSNSDQSEYGMRFGDTEYIEVHNNTFTNGTIELDIARIKEGKQSEPTGNFFGGQKTLFLFNRKDLDRDMSGDHGYIYFVNISSSVLVNASIKDDDRLEMIECHHMTLYNGRINGSTLILSHCHSVEISACEISGVTDGPGLEIRDSSNVRTYESTIRGCQIGILVNQSWNCRLEGNRIIDSKYSGIECIGSGGNILAVGNLIINSGSNGIELEVKYSSWDNIIANNTIVGSKGYALKIIYYSDGWIYGNTFIMNNGTTDLPDPNHSQIYIGGYMVLYDPTTHKGNFWYDLDDDSRRAATLSYNGYDNFDPDRSRIGDLYPLAMPSKGSPPAPGYEDLWEGGPVLKREINYTSEYCCLSVVLVMFLLIVFILRNNAVKKRDINLQHRRRPWEFEDLMKYGPQGRITPKELRKPKK